MVVLEAVQELIQRNFQGKGKLYIGLDSAIGVGNPVTLVVSLVLIPVTLILAVIRELAVKMRISHVKSIFPADTNGLQTF